MYKDNKASLLKSVLTDMLEDYSREVYAPDYEIKGPAHHMPDTFKVSDFYKSLSNNNSNNFLVRFDDKLFDELKELEKRYQFYIHTVDDSTIIVTPIFGSVCFNITVVKNCNYIPVHVLYLVSDIMPFDLQIAFLDNISTVKDSFKTVSVQEDFSKDYNDIYPEELESLEDSSGLIRLPGMKGYVNSCIDLSVEESDFYVFKNEKSITKWNDVVIDVGECCFGRGTFTLAIDGRKVLNSLTIKVDSFPNPDNNWMEKLTFNVIITRPSQFFSMNKLVFDCPSDITYPENLTINYFLYDFENKIVTDSMYTWPLLSVDSHDYFFDHIDCKGNPHKIKFNIYSSCANKGLRFDYYSHSSCSRHVLAMGNSTYAQDYRDVKSMLYNVCVPVAAGFPLVDTDDDCKDYNKNANYIFKRTIRKLDKEE